jgi:Pyruvate/2-oxoacid:ferredoxin oxidoreductase delta subunit
VKVDELALEGDGADRYGPGLAVAGEPGKRYAIDLDYCKGCGICVAECPRRAMEMVADAAVR